MHAYILQLQANQNFVGETAQLHKHRYACSLLSYIHTYMHAYKLQLKANQNIVGGTVLVGVNMARFVGQVSMHIYIYI